MYMKGSIFSYDFFIAAIMLLIVIIAILNIQFEKPTFNRKSFDLAISLDDKGVFWKSRGTINESLEGNSAIIKCYKYTGTWDLDYEKAIINGKPSFWYRMVRIHDGDFCTIDVGI